MDTSSSSDSDIEICFGPLSLDEVKYYVLKEKSRPISRSRSLNFIPQSSYENVLNEAKHNSDQRSDSDQDNLSTVTSQMSFMNSSKIKSEQDTEFFTCDESIQNTEEINESIITISDDNDDEIEEKEANNSLMKGSNNESLSEFSFQNSTGDNSMNDTLENIERLLNSDKENHKHLNADDEDSNSKFKIIQNITLSKSNDNTKEISSKSCIPIRKPTMPEEKSYTKDQFKIPVTPNVKSKFKNIISPVAMYIKYSPTAPIMRNVRGKPNASSSSVISKPLEIISQEPKLDIPTLPQIIYKPSIKQLNNFEERLKLPSTILKFIPDATIIKHEKRIHGKVYSPKTISRRLELNLNLSDDELDTSDNVDISIWTHKPAFIEETRH